MSNPKKITRSHENKQKMQIQWTVAAYSVIFQKKTRPKVHTSSLPHCQKKIVERMFQIIAKCSNDNYIILFYNDFNVQT
jgi:hypothetical protein